MIDSATCPSPKYPQLLRPMHVPSFIPSNTCASCVGRTGVMVSTGLRKSLDILSGSLDDRSQVAPAHHVYPRGSRARSGQARRYSPTKPWGTRIRLSRTIPHPAPSNAVVH